MNISANKRKTKAKNNFKTLIYKFKEYEKYLIY
jgi:hypothetical protein